MDDNQVNFKLEILGAESQKIIGIMGARSVTRRDRLFISTYIYWLILIYRDGDTKMWALCIILMATHDSTVCTPTHYQACSLV